MADEPKDEQTTAVADAEPKGEHTAVDLDDEQDVVAKIMSAPKVRYSIMDPDAEAEGDEEPEKEQLKAEETPAEKPEAEPPPTPEPAKPAPTTKLKDEILGVEIDLSLMPEALRQSYGTIRDAYHSKAQSLESELQQSRYWADIGRAMVLQGRAAGQPQVGAPTPPADLQTPPSAPPVAPVMQPLPVGPLLQPEELADLEPAEVAKRVNQRWTQTVQGIQQQAAQATMQAVVQQLQPMLSDVRVFTETQRVNKQRAVLFDTWKGQLDPRLREVAEQAGIEGLNAYHDNGTLGGRATYDDSLHLWMRDQARKSAAERVRQSYGAGLERKVRAVEAQVTSGGPRKVETEPPEVSQREALTEEAERLWPSRR